jgi:hypothetical protein
MSHLCFLESFLRKQLASRLIVSSMSHKAKGLSRDRYQNEERSLSFAYNERQRISVLSVLEREARGNGRTFVTWLKQVSKYCNR